MYNISPLFTEPAYCSAHAW